MSTNALFPRASSLFSAFRRAEGGNVAVMFALTLVPVVGLVGAAIDYSRANAIRTNMQAAADSAALAVSKTASSQTSDQIQSDADANFRALITQPDANITGVTATYTKSTVSNVVVEATGTMKTRFMGLLGFSQMNLKVRSTTAWGNTKLRVALVLDNTGSMDSSGKMDALKTASKNLLTQLKAAATTNGDVYVSIIPFSVDVNLGSSNYAATWIDWTDWEANTPSSVPSMSVGPGSTCPWNSGYSTKQCLTTPGGTTTTDTVPSSGTYKGYICPSFTGGSLSNSNKAVYYNGCYTSTTYSCTGSSCSCTGHSNCTCSGSGSSKTCATNANRYEHTWVPNPHSTWNGCTTDRGTTSAPSPTGTGAGYDQNITAASTTTAATLYPAEQYAYCSATVSGLSYDWTTMASMIDGMTPVGATNQPIGLVWGWQSLVGGGPLTAPTMDTTNYQYQQVIILLSDGLNTQNRWYGNGSSTSTSVDYRMYDTSGYGTCKNIKSAGITIYTIQVNTGGDPTSTLLQNCASDSSKFYLLTSSSQIITAFDQIGTQLTRLRVAK